MNRLGLADRQKGKNNEDQERWENLAKYVFYSSLVFAVVLLLYTLFADQGIVDLHRFQLRVRELEGSIKYINETNDKLKEEIKLLRDNPKYIEKIAREELGLAKPGEVVYHIRDAGTETINPAVVQGNKAAKR